jgi:hypothetical protein
MKNTFTQHRNHTNDYMENCGLVIYGWLPALCLSEGSNHNSDFAWTMWDVVVLHGRSGWWDGAQRYPSQRSSRGVNWGHFIVALGESTVELKHIFREVPNQCSPNFFEPRHTRRKWEISRHTNQLFFNLFEKKLTVWKGKILTVFATQ